MSKRETCLLALACTSIGIIIGFLCAPIKNGIRVTCGNHNTLANPKKHDRKQKRFIRKQARTVPFSQEDDTEIF